MAGGEKERKIRTHAACNEHHRPLRNDLPKKLDEIFHMIGGIHRLGGAFGFSKTDEVRSYDFMVDSRSGVNF